MTLLGFLELAFVVWLALSIPAALLLGAMLREADRREPAPRLRVIGDDERLAS